MKKGFLSKLLLCLPLICISAFCLTACCGDNNVNNNGGNNQNGDGQNEDNNINDNSITNDGVVADVTIDGLKYHIENGTATVTDVENKETLTTVTIPEKISYKGKNYTVTSIRTYAFSNCTSLTSIEIPDSVTRIGFRAFYECTSLTSIVIGDSVTSIGEDAFYNCNSALYTTENNLKYVKANGNPYYLLQGVTNKKLFTYTINANTVHIGERAFEYCSRLSSITIPDSVTSIGNYAFSNCTLLTSIEIPDSVTSIGDDAFSNCTLLRSITFNGTVEEWNAIEKGDYWDYNVPATQVICTDGTVSI